MKYQKIINFLDNKVNQPFPFTTKNCIEINEKCNTNTQIN